MKKEIEVSPEEEKILDKCERLFMRYGVKSVTMDDVSRELGISKKTLYQYVENKDDLVKRVTQSHFESETQVIEEICDNSKNAVEEMWSITTCINDHLNNVNPSLIFDLKKYHPASWTIFIEHRNQQIFNCIKRNIEKGKEQGLYRHDVNTDLIARFYIGRIEMLIDSEIIPFDKYDLKEVRFTYIDYHLRGVATTKGIKILEKIKNKNA